jgi:hypothetical protein
MTGHVDPAEYARAANGKPLPEIGTVWRERRREYAKRTVVVQAADQHFVYIETLTTDRGTPPQRSVRTRVRANLWHKTFTPATGSWNEGG